MAPRDSTGFSLRWEFVPLIEGADGAVHWAWAAYRQNGELFTKSDETFETFTECVEDAKRHGYWPPPVR